MEVLDVSSYGDYAAQTMLEDFNLEEFYKAMKERLKESESNVVRFWPSQGNIKIKEEFDKDDDWYIRVELKYFDNVDEDFVDYIRENHQDIDMVKHSDFFIVKKDGEKDN